MTCTQDSLPELMFKILIQDSIELLLTHNMIIDRMASRWNLYMGNKKDSYHVSKIQFAIVSFYHIKTFERDIFHAASSFSYLAQIPKTPSKRLN